MCRQSDNRRRHRAGCSRVWNRPHGMFGIRSSARYCGANPCNDLKINIASLNNIVCAQTRTASEGWRACRWCGLSAEDRRRIGQRRWAQIGGDDTRRPGFRSGWRSRSPGDSVPALWPASDRLMPGLNAGCCKLAQRSETPGLNPSQTGWYSIYLPWRDGRLSWPRNFYSRQKQVIRRISLPRY